MGLPMIPSPTKPTFSATLISLLEHEVFDAHVAAAQLLGDPREAVLGPLRGRVVLQAHIPVVAQLNQPPPPSRTALNGASLNRIETLAQNFIYEPLPLTSPALHLYVPRFAQLNSVPSPLSQHCDVHHRARCYTREERISLSGK